jgi:hypothetical protein
MLLCVNLSNDLPRTGIGSPKHYKELKSCRFLLLQIMIKIRVDVQSPLSWHRSKVFSLFKKNPAKVNVPFDAQRAIHSLDAFGKAYYKNIWDRSTHTEPLEYEFGYVKNRRRESAILHNLLCNGDLEPIIVLISMLAMT